MSKFRVVVLSTAVVLCAAGWSVGSAGASAVRPAARPVSVVDKVIGTSPDSLNAPRLRLGSNSVQGGVVSHTGSGPADIIDPTTARPDPSIIWDPGTRKYVMYTSSAGYYNIPMWTANSVEGPWTLLRDAVPVAPAWSYNTLHNWKPSVNNINGTWTLWSSADHGNRDLCLYRATAASATGVFSAPPNQQVWCDIGRGGDIDPITVRDDSGGWWLVYKVNSNVVGEPTQILSMRLGPDGLPTGPVTTLITADQPWETNLIEAPSFFRDPGTGAWWLALSGGDFGGVPTYQVVAVPCAGPAGPCDEGAMVRLVSNNAQGAGPGEEGMFTDPGGAIWMAYNPDGPFPDAGGRPLALVRIAFVGGVPQIVAPSAGPPAQISGPIVGAGAPASGKGYWLANSQGYLNAKGQVSAYGSLVESGMSSLVVGLTPSPSGKGYWLVGSDGGVFPFGDAQFYGSMGGKALNQPIVGMAATPDGKGYWLVATDGGIFAFGDAIFHGSMGGAVLNKPIVGIANDPVTGGYWEVASDGGVFAFNAPFFGSTGAITLNQPVRAMVATADGQGYGFVAADGGVFCYGNFAFAGSTGAMRLNSAITTMIADQATGGYWLVGSDGGIFAFKAPFYGAG